MYASSLPIAQLGSTIKVHLTNVEKYIDKCEQHTMSAGLHLVEAKTRIQAGEYDGAFAKFLIEECGGLSTSRAYELISIANGTKTVEDHRQRAREGMQASRARSATSAALLAAAEKEKLAEMLKEEARKKRSASKAAKDALRNVTDSVTEITNAMKLVSAITAACQGVAFGELEYVLGYLRNAAKA